MDQQVDNCQQLIKEIFHLVHEEDLPSLILKYKITRGELADALRPLNYEVTETGFLIEEVKELARGQDVDLSFLSPRSLLSQRTLHAERLGCELCPLRLLRLRQNSSAARTATKSSRITQGAAAMEPPARAHTTASDTDDLARDRVDIAFLDVDSPAVIMANEVPAADATHDSQVDAQVGNGENSAAGDNSDETSSVSIVSSEEFLRLTREAYAEANARRQNAPQTWSISHAMNGTLTFGEVSRILPEARFQAVVHHIFNFREGADLTSFWKLKGEASGPTRLLTHYVLNFSIHLVKRPSQYHIVEPPHL
ncbi:hypothetical protein DPV78_000949 [Talaromyces pinophilus]|nr:hypothetical protein DPV78_000949 [Talaromyces pinophilus]